MRPYNCIIFLLRSGNQVRNQMVRDRRAETGDKIIACAGFADATSAATLNIMVIAGVLCGGTGNVVQFLVGILHAAGTPGVGDSQHASPHWSGNAGATYNDKTTNGFVVDDNTRIGIGNHRHVGDTTTGVGVEAVLVGWAGLKCAQATATAAPRSLTEITAGSGRFQGGAAYRGNKWRGGWILRATAAIAGRSGEASTIPNHHPADVYVSFAGLLAARSFPRRPSNDH